MSAEKEKAKREAVIQVQLEAIHWLESKRGEEHLRRALIKALDAIDGFTSNLRVAGL